MIAAEVIAPASAGYRTVDDVLARAIVILGIFVVQRTAEIAQIDEIKTGRGDVKGGMAQIAPVPGGDAGKIQLSASAVHPEESLLCFGQ